MDFNLEQYLNNGVTDIARDIAKASLTNPKTSLFMAQFAIAAKNANKKRNEAEKNGEHIPAFLMASITTKCNLHCAGCYARASHGCVDSDAALANLLPAPDWDRIFDEAETLGIAFILLAGGEPFLRQDVLRAAGTHKKILFPIFTNGTMLDSEAMQLLKDCPNLLPILSIEGDQTITDQRRGNGVYASLRETMSSLREQSKLFGCSITVQNHNMEAVLGDSFVSEMETAGCRGMIYVEYVPIDQSSESLAPGPEERKYIARRVDALRAAHPDIIIISFPGDEQAAGGCLAAGRGFFHINAYGGAEPCPFSAHSDCSLKNMSLKEAMHSPLFTKLRTSGVLEEPHVGSCTLFLQDAKVKALEKGENV